MNIKDIFKWAISLNSFPLWSQPDPINGELKVTRRSFFLGGGGVPSYFEALWYPHLYFYRKSNT